MSAFELKLKLHLVSYRTVNSVHVVLIIIIIQCPLSKYKFLPYNFLYTLTMTFCYACLSQMQWHRQDLAWGWAQNDIKITFKSHTQNNTKYGLHITPCYKKIWYTLFIFFNKIKNELILKMVVCKILTVFHIRYYYHTVYGSKCLQCFDAVGWAAGRASGL